MTTSQIIGAAMIAAPFVALFIFIAVTERSLKVPSAIFGSVLALVAFIGAGAYLLTGGQ